jgi:hypothetical protein
LLYAGIYSSWIDKSIVKLAELFPAVYARAEEHSDFIATIDSFRYALKEPEPVVADASAAEHQPSGSAPQESEDGAPAVPAEGQDGVVATASP